MTAFQLRPEQINVFQKHVLEHYRRHGRKFPWRDTIDPYQILVSEIMLQQTQVDRVIPKFEAFINRFQNPAELAAAPLRDVLAMWQGLGYNRRAQALHRCAILIVNEHGGRLPKTREGLQALPGIGPYTAAAVSVFAYNRPCVFIETNIRAVYIHCFFPDAQDVSDAQLKPLIEATLYKRDPRRWYNALMDYGVQIKKLHGNPARRSRHHSVQSRFEGSDRQIRGMIVRILGETKEMNTRELMRRIGREPERVRAIIEQLAAEGLVVINRTRLSLP
ncbi:MAG: A/G-specific adenine glycosylase [Deltaproteobacteria bacterium]|nr:A/G-specific adenine glycosylase [Deltaproteobacteria bacterium]